VRREEIRPLTPEQVKMLLDAASGDRLEALHVQNLMAARVFLLLLIIGVAFLNDILGQP
jgi:hypothetical protein